MSGKKLVTCKRCGRNDLVWRESKTGKFYLTYDGGVEIKGGNGRTIKRVYSAHECLVRDGELTERRASFIVIGLITTTPEEQAEALAFIKAEEEKALGKVGR
jgi:hypothetical protein